MLAHVSNNASETARNEDSTSYGHAVELLPMPALAAAKLWEEMPSLWSVAILTSPWMGPPMCTAQVRGLDRSVAILISPWTDQPTYTAQVKSSDSSQV